MIIEKVTEIVKFTEKYGEDYDTQMTLQWITPEWVYIKNLSGIFSRLKREELRQYLISQGVKKVTFTRYRRGERKDYEISMDREKI